MHHPSASWNSFVCLQMQQQINVALTELIYVALDFKTPLSHIRKTNNSFACLHCFDARKTETGYLGLA